MKDQFEQEDSYRLAHGLAHSFNELLFAIVGYTELARLSAPSDHAVNQYFDGIVGAASEALEFTDNLLEAARRHSASFTARRPNTGKGPGEDLALEADFMGAALRWIADSGRDRSEQDAPREHGQGTILLVDSNPAQHKSVVVELKRRGYRVEQADNCWSALYLAAQRGFPFDLFITDAAPPVFSVQDIVAIMTESNPHTQILLMSDPQSSIVANDLMSSRITCLPKPFSTEALVEKVQQILKA